MIITKTRPLPSTASYPLLRAPTVSKLRLTRGVGRESIVTSGSRQRCAPDAAAGTQIPRIEVRARSGHERRLLLEHGREVILQTKARVALEH